MTARERSNRISGCKTQLKRHAGGAREPELQRYLEHLLREQAEAPIRARLEQLDQRWDDLVEKAAATLFGAAGDYRKITAGRNLKSRKRARRGLAPLETVANEMRRVAEARMLKALEASATEAWAARQLAEIEEAATLRARLTREIEIAA